MTRPRHFCFLLALGLAACSGPAAEQLSAKCLDLTAEHAEASFAGKLTVQLFAGPPNFESIAAGDAEEKAFILELPERHCAFDAEFISKDASFDRVHVSSHDDAILAILKASVGREIIATGTAFGSHTGRHHAPLVLMAESVTVGAPEAK